MAVPRPSSAEIAAEPSKDRELRRVIIVLSVRCSDEGNDRSAMKERLNRLATDPKNSQPPRAPHTRSPSMSVAVVSGFSDPTGFSKVFARRYELIPSAVLTPMRALLDIGTRQYHTPAKWYLEVPH
jgi:AraC-like DNA-binding protein